MKKILTIALLFSLVFARSTNPRITCDTANTYPKESKNAISLEIINATLSPSPDGTIEWTAYNISGANAADFYVTNITPSGHITTLTATPIYDNGEQVTASQTLTTGTDLTDFRGIHYKFTLTNTYDVTQNVSMNFIVTGVDY